MRLGVSIDFRSAVEALDGAQKRQVPFAIANTLNDVAFLARHHVVNVTGPRDFDIRNKRFLGVALQIGKVGKASKYNLVATIYDKLGRSFLKVQADGGTKRPEKPGRFAIPLGKMADKRKSRGIPKNMRPLTMPNTFKLRTRGGGEVIARRVGRARRVEVVYALKRTAELPQRFNVYRDVGQVVAANIDRVFAAQMARALASARS